MVWKIEFGANSLFFFFLGSDFLFLILISCNVYIIALRSRMRETVDNQEE